MPRGKRYPSVEFTFERGVEMRKFYFLVSSAIAAQMIAAPAGAADLPVKARPLPPPPVYSWTGFYIGAHAGYGWGEKEFSGDFAGRRFPLDAANANLDCAGPDQVCLDFSALTNSFLTQRLSGALGGVQAGYNYQFGVWVGGIEGQFSWSRLRKESAVEVGRSICSFESAGTCFPLSTLSGFPVDLRAKTQVDWIATVAARLGYTWDRWLLYLKGGAAFAKDSYSFTFSDVTTPLTIHQFDQTRVGWMVGAGFEWALWDNWTAKLEYNYMGFGNDDLAVAPVRICHHRLSTESCQTQDFRIGVDQHIHVVKFGVNWRIGSTVAVVAKY
jgi:outer membrane immunogenic protein